MPTDDNDLSRVLARHPLRVNERPLQRGGDTLLRSATAGGPAEDGDRRMFLDAKLLRQLLAMAESSPMQRVQVERAGLRVDLYCTPAGHQYEVWTFVGADVRPEPLPAALAGM